MIVICPKCGERYDDVYRKTTCPHNKFQMNTLVVHSGLPPEDYEVAHTIEQMQAIQRRQRVKYRQLLRKADQIRRGEPPTGLPSFLPADPTKEDISAL